MFSRSVWQDTDRRVFFERTVLGSWARRRGKCDRDWLETRWGRAHVYLADGEKRQRIHAMPCKRWKTFSDRRRMTSERLSIADNASVFGTALTTFVSQQVSTYDSERQLLGKSSSDARLLSESKRTDYMPDSIWSADQVGIITITKKSGQIHLLTNQHKTSNTWVNVAKRITKPICGSNSKLWLLLYLLLCTNSIKIAIPPGIFNQSQSYLMRSDLKRPT